MQDYQEFVTNIDQKLGIDLNLYKETQMKRRLTSLRDKRGYSSFATYYRELNTNKELLQEFIDRITINVSEFYRNPKRWHVLEKQVLPMLVKKGRPLTIWSAACSTGEEPYSLAILLNEYFPNVNYTITATDIDDAALGKARNGIYQEKALKELPSNLKEKYFHQENGIYHVKKVVKQNITFKKHNLLRDRYPARVDLIVCRNVLIYFTEQAKATIYKRFSASLQDNGIFFVGSTEQIFHPQEYGLQLFDTFFYQKKS